MSPNYNEGDFVLVTKSPFVIKNLSVGDVIVFFHHSYGLLIKRIKSVSPGGDYYVNGINSLSIDSKRIGTIERKNISGKVILHMRRNGQKNTKVKDIFSRKGK